MGGLERHQEAVAGKADERELEGKFAEHAERGKRGDFMEDQRDAIAHFAAHRMLMNPEASAGGMPDMSMAGWAETRDRSMDRATPSEAPSPIPSPVPTPARTPMKVEQLTPPQARTPPAPRPRAGGFAARQSASNKKTKRTRDAAEYDGTAGDFGEVSVNKNTQTTDG